MEVLGATAGRSCAPTITGPARRAGARAGRGVPDGAGRPALFVVKPSGGRDLGAGDVLRAADRRAVRALRRARHADGWTDGPRPCSSPTCASSSSASRRRRTSPRSPARPTWSRGSARPARRRAGARSWSTAARTCAGGSGDGPSRVLVLGHHDTVWPLGSLATHPWSVDGGVLRGPGCFDMKAGLAMAFHALAALGERRRGHAARHRRRGDRLAELARADRGGGPVRVGRAGARGVGRRRSAQDRAQGRRRCTRCACSAAPRTPGLEPERGVNATLELAHQVLAVAALGDPDTGTTVTPTVARAGTTTNTVPADGRSRSTSGSGPRRAGPGRCRHARAAPRCCPAPRSRSRRARTVRRWRPRRRPGCSTRAARLAARARPAGARPPRPSAARRTATSPPGSARRPSTASARSAAARTPTTSTCSSMRCPAVPRCSRALVADLLADLPTSLLEPTGAARP